VLTRFAPRDYVEGHYTGLLSSTKLLLTIWGLANQETFRQLAERFSITRPYAHYVFQQCCRILTQMAPDVVIWPSRDEIIQTATSSSFPGAFAAVDGTHIPIKTPHTCEDSYMNRKSYASIVLQAVCTPDLQFIDISTGWPGSMHYARIYRRSKLHELLSSGKLGKDVHILGNLAYPLQENLMVPFHNSGHRSVKQKKFNNLHSAYRCCTGRAFGLLKRKFRRLNYLDVCNLENAPVMIIAACTLHNFILQNENDIVNFEDIKLEKDKVGVQYLPTSKSTTSEAAVHKRYAIVAKL